MGSWNSSSSTTEPGKCRNREGERKDVKRNFRGISSSEEEGLSFRKEKRKKPLQCDWNGRSGVCGVIWRRADAMPTWR